MAIKIHDFYRKYRLRTTALVAFIQILGALCASAMTWVLLNLFQLDLLTAFVLSMAGAIAAMLLITPLLLDVIGTPLRILTQSIAHVSKDPVVTPPPDIRGKYYERTGLKGLVQTVYELAIAAYPHGEKSETVALAGDFFRKMAESTSCGLIAIGSKNEVLYANPAAPVSQTSNGGHQINLIFEQNNDLSSWLADCRANKVRDDHLWVRVGDKLPSEENRRIFDIIGHYQKNDESGIEVTLVTFDRTSLYAMDQEDMDFIALAAHELRGPITVIRGYLDVFNQEIGEKLDEEQHALLDRLQVSAERLSGYVNNILNVSRYDRHQFIMHAHEESLLEIIKSLVPDLALRAKTQNRSVSFHIPPDLPTVAADRSGISEVITNLIDNAIKYSHEGGEVVVGATKKENFVEVTVTDTGIGMPGPVVSNLFNRFYRSHRSKKSVGGTGLGLYICKAILQSHGGTIWVRSQEDKGSTFGFTLPIYASIADKIGNGDNKDIVQRSEGWIKNHAMYRR